MKKGETSADHMKKVSNTHIENRHEDKLHVFTDGSKDPDKQTTGAAFVIPSLDIREGFKCNSNLSIFTTEFIAIEHAINWITENNIPDSIIFTDSLSSVQALLVGKSRIRPDKINQILTLLDSAKSKGNVIQIVWIPSHVGIAGNEMADFTAKNAMINGVEDKTRPAKTKIYSVINKAIMTKWQQQFDHPLPDKKSVQHYKGRHYYHLQRNVKKDAVMYSPDRLHDKVYTRLRLGYSRLGMHCKWDKEIKGKTAL